MSEQPVAIGQTHELKIIFPSDGLSGGKQVTTLLPRRCRSGRNALPPPSPHPHAPAYVYTSCAGSPICSDQSYSSYQDHQTNPRTKTLKLIHTAPVGFWRQNTLGWLFLHTNINRFCFKIQIVAQTIPLFQRFSHSFSSIQYINQLKTKHKIRHALFTLTEIALARSHWFLNACNCNYSKDLCFVVLDLNQGKCWCSMLWISQLQSNKNSENRIWVRKISPTAQSPEYLYIYEWCCFSVYTAIWVIEFEKNRRRDS